LRVDGVGAGSHKAPPNGDASSKRLLLFGAWAGCCERRRRVTDKAVTSTRVDAYGKNGGARLIRCATPHAVGGAVMTDLTPAITLHFLDHVRVPGDTLQEHVALDVARAQEEKIYQLRVGLCGVIKT
jgi:hypothetical protein